MDEPEKPKKQESQQSSTSHKPKNYKSVEEIGANDVEKDQEEVSSEDDIQLK